MAIEGHVPLTVYALRAYKILARLTLMLGSPPRTAEWGCHETAESR